MSLQNSMESGDLALREIIRRHRVPSQQKEDTVRVVSMMSQKGGSGKTTLAISLAGAMTATNERVLILDTDPQVNAAQWADRREAQWPEVMDCSPNRVASHIESAKSRGYDWVIVDTPRSSADGVVAIAARADAILIPCQISTFDMDAIKITLDVVALAGARDRARVVLNAVPPNATTLIEKARRGLAKRGAVTLESVVRYRAPFRHSTDTGNHIGEIAGATAAHGDVAELWAEVLQFCDAAAQDAA